VEFVQVIIASVFLDQLALAEDVIVKLILTSQRMGLRRCELYE
jgi:hypothetical protein